MKILNKNEIKLIKQCIKNEIETSSDYAYLESKQGNDERAYEIEKYIEELEKLYKKI